MADPNPYVVSYDFSAFQASNPASPLPANQVDAQLQNIAASTVELVDALTDVRRSDGALKNGIVTIDSLDATVAAGVSEGVGAAQSIAAAAAASASASSASGSAVAAAASAAAAAATAGANASTIVFTPTGNIAATTVAAALAELDNEKSGTAHVHNANTVVTSAITGLAGTSNVQALLEALFALMPQTGDVALSIDNSVPSGWLLMDDATIGDGSSGATHAHPTLYTALYTLLWNKVSNTYAPVSTGRGANAAADFAAHKTITLTKGLGRVLGIAGAGSGLTSRAVGEVLGEEGHQLIAAENAPHRHNVFLNDPGHSHDSGTGHSNGYQSGTVSGGAVVLVMTTDGNPASTDSKTTGITVRDTAGGVGTANQTALTGSGDAHNTMQPTLFLYARIKL